MNPCGWHQIPTLASVWLSRNQNPSHVFFPVGLQLSSRCPEQPRVVIWLPITFLAPQTSILHWESCGYSILYSLLGVQSWLIRTNQGANVDDSLPNVSVFSTSSISNISVTGFNKLWSSVDGRHEGSNSDVFDKNIAVWIAHTSTKAKLMIV